MKSINKKIGKKIFVDKTVLELAKERIAWAFENNDSVVCGFSGGKDSTVAFHLCYEYAKEHNCLQKLVMFHVDFECLYSEVIDYVTWAFDEGYQGCRKVWMALPFMARCCTSLEEGGTWRPFDPSKENIWVRKYPNKDYVLNLQNMPEDMEWDWSTFTDHEAMTAFIDWNARHYGKTASIIGIRTDESMDRYTMIVGTSDTTIDLRVDGKHWTMKDPTRHITRVYPLYDWSVNDDWVYMYQNNVRYCKLYDLYFQAGLNPSQMRVASPFLETATANLKLYKVLDPKTWSKMIGRVNGVDCTALYGSTKLYGWRDLSKPNHLTWEKYAKFLLQTYSDTVREHFEKILNTSYEYWCSPKGRLSALTQDTINELKTFYPNEEIEVLGEDKRLKGKYNVIFKKYPEDTSLCKEWMNLPSWKRVVVTLSKNDYFGKTMGFQPSKKEIENRDANLNKYKEMKILSEADRETQYQEGQKVLEELKKRGEL